MNKDNLNDEMLHTEDQDTSLNNEDDRLDHIMNEIQQEAAFDKAETTIQIPEMSEYSEIEISEEKEKGSKNFQNKLSSFMKETKESMQKKIKKPDFKKPEIKNPFAKNDKKEKQEENSEEKTTGNVKDKFYNFMEETKQKFHKKEVSEKEKNKTVEAVQEKALACKNVILKYFHICKDKVQNVYDKLKRIMNNTMDKLHKMIVKEPGQKIVKLKLFFVCDMDEEAKYLHKMSLKGLHFVSKNGIRYYFVVDEPKNYYYHLGYYEKDKRNGERYVENYLEAGWDNIYHEKSEFDGVLHYFRTEASEEEGDIEIFSDRMSRIALYKRLVVSWRPMIVMIVFCIALLCFVCYFLMTHVSDLQTMFMTLWTIVMIFMLWMLFIYVRTTVKISRKLKEFMY